MKLPPKSPFVGGRTAKSSRKQEKDKGASLSKIERERKIKAIYRDFEAKKRAIGLKAPTLKRGPVFYLVVLLVLGFLGASIIQLTRDDVVARKAMDARQARAQKSVDALAEALGRYKFHCGEYPSEADGGLEALSRKSSPHKGWVGPYATRIVDDPWKRPYVYEPFTNGAHPAVLSLGADGARGTVDDITPSPGLFEKPFRDTTWTNDWVPYWNRGIIVRPRK